ncbi:MAG: acyl-CoA/acyl-ACP dehydrogenase [Dehalococcoidales bacterium]|nr:acyl-CoA/acyl-ACP dehydrogenase [Dehalococcoidales bacterium]
MMEYGINEEQEMLKTMARDFLAKECPKTFTRAMMNDQTGITKDYWKKMADVGWTGLILPEQYGGANMTFRDLSILCEEMGRMVMPGPFVSTLVMSALPILNAGTEAQKQEFLPRIANGQMIMTAAVTETDGDFWPGGVNMQAYPRGEDYILTGAKSFVPDAMAADWFLVACRTKTSADPEEGITLCLVNKDDWGIYVNPLKTMDETRKQYQVTFNRIAVPAKYILGEVNKGWRYLKDAALRATALHCAEMVGGGEWVLETCVEYAKTRVQFGAPIGSFQAVKHHLANMYTQLEYARALMVWAAESVKENDPQADLAVNMAKAYCGDTFKMVAGLGIQIHGGIGFTWDHDMHLYFKRSRALDTVFGDANYHRELIAQHYD